MTFEAIRRPRGIAMDGVVGKNRRLPGTERERDDDARGEREEEEEDGLLAGQLAAPKVFSGRSPGS